MSSLSLQEQMKLIKENPINIKNIENPYEEVCLEVIKQSIFLVEYIPKDKLTEELYIKAARYNGYIIEFIPKELQTEKIYLETIKEDAFSIQFIDEDKLTDNICLEAIKTNPYTLQYIPKSKQTLEMCLEAVKSDGLCLQYIPKENLTKEIYIEAVRNDEWAMKSIDKEYQTEDICLEAVKNDGYAIEYIDKEKLTKKVILYAFLNKYQLIDTEYIKKSIDDFVKKRKLTNMIFYNDLEKENIIKIFNEDKIEDKYDLINLSLESLVYLQDYLLKENYNNTFVLLDSINLDILKEIALSNNELIVVDTGNINDIHRKLANKIITL